MEIIKFTTLLERKRRLYQGLNTINELSKLSKKNKRLSIGINFTYIGSNFHYKKFISRTFKSKT